MKRISAGAMLLLGTALALALWLGATWIAHGVLHPGRAIGNVLFATQDMPALLLGIGALLLCIPFAGRGRSDASAHWVRNPVPVIALFAAFALLAWAMNRWLFDGYALSRDEEVAQFATRYMREGMIGRPIPPEWLEYRRAIMPEFFLPFGADHFWAAAYLPVNSAIRAAFGALGDASLSGPALLLAGLVALWSVALRLFPGRDDAVLVVIAMAVGSAQLLLTAMTPYAMTGHFAFNMIWLALVLHDRRWSHIAAGVVAILLAGLHQWHFPLIFLAPFILWFALQRRWGVMLFHAGVLILTVVIWAKLWPGFMLDTLGPPADVLPAAGVGSKMASLLSRLESWHPLLHLTRFAAWNNLLLLPLAVIAAVTMPWRAALRGQSPLLPLALGAMGASALAIDQGYGWGYRYLHGYIGSFALLGGYGWVRLGHRSLRPIWLSVLVALLTGSFLTMRAHDYVEPYARAHRLIHGTDADVVLIDSRGGRFVSDLVRGQEGYPLRRPIVMNLGQLTASKLDRLCARYSVAVFDRSAFLPLGVGAVHWNSKHIAALRARMVESGCGAVISAPPR